MEAVMSWIKRVLRIAALGGATMLVPLAGTAWAQPSNDSISGATVISAVPFSITEDTTPATLGPEDTAVGALGCGSGFTFSNSVWFAYTPSSDQQLGVNTAGSSYSVAGAVVTGTPASFSVVSCFLGSASFQATQGTTYYIDLLQFGAGSGGTLSLSLTQLVPPNPVLTVNSSGTFNSKSGAATVSGTASCGLGSSAFLSGSLTQNVGRVFTVSGSGSPADSIVCDGTPHPWSIVVTPFSGVFKGGKATASVSLDACNLFTCDFKQVTQTIQLKH
jgi:hypothetical protein